MPGSVGQRRDFSDCVASVDDPPRSVIAKKSQTPSPKRRAIDLAKRPNARNIRAATRAHAMKPPATVLSVER
jgi:hypothetical protein